MSLSDLNLSQRVILGKSWSKHPSVWRRTHTMTQCWTVRLTLGVAGALHAYFSGMQVEVEVMLKVDFVRR